MNESPPATPGISKPSPPGVPGNPQEVESLLEQRPAAWAHLLFGGLLLQGKQGLELSWRDHQLRLPTANYHRVDEEHVATYLSDAFGRLGWILEPVERVFGAQEDAFGKPGEPGNALLIEHFAKWIISTYERLLEWAGTIRSAGAPEGFGGVFELAAQAADRPLDQLRAFIDELVLQLQQLSTHAAKSDTERKTLTIESHLTLSADDQLMEEAVDELRRALGQDP